METIDCGKPIEESRWDINNVVNTFEFFSGTAPNIAGKTIFSSKCDILVWVSSENLSLHTLGYFKNSYELLVIMYFAIPAKYSVSFVTTSALT